MKLEDIDCQMNYLRELLKGKTILRDLINFRDYCYLSVCL